MAPSCGPDSAATRSVWAAEAHPDARWLELKIGAGGVRSQFEFRRVCFVTALVRVSVLAVRRGARRVPRARLGAGCARHHRAVRGQRADAERDAGRARERRRSVRWDGGSGGGGSGGGEREPSRTAAAGRAIRSRLDRGLAWLDLASKLIFIYLRMVTSLFSLFSACLRIGQAARCMATSKSTKVGRTKETVKWWDWRADCANPACGR